MEPGDILVLYTDGVTEAFDGAHRMFGEDRLQAIVAEHAHEPPTELIASIVAALRRHAGTTPQSDDLTVLVLRIDTLLADTQSAEHVQASAGMSATVAGTPGVLTSDKPKGEA